MEDHWKNRAKDCTSLSVCTTVHLVPHWVKNGNFPNFACTMGHWVTHWHNGTKKGIFPQSAWTTVHLLANWHSGTKKCLKVRQVLKTTNSKVWMFLKNWQSGAKNCTIPQSACTMVHLVAQCQSGAKNYNFPHSASNMVHLVAHSASSMVHLVAHWQSGPKIALFHSQPVLWYIWWPTGKVVQKIALFPI